MINSGRDRPMNERDKRCRVPTRRGGTVSSCYSDVLAGCSVNKQARRLAVGVVTDCIDPLPGRRTKGACVPGKRVHFDEETWQALDLLARETMKDFQELADEAFRDLLKKHDRPTDLKAALRQSAGQSAKIHKLHPKKKKRK